MVYRTKVYANEVRYNQVRRTLYPIGQITYSSTADAFIKAVRLFNRENHGDIAFPRFKDRGHTFGIVEYGIPSKTGKRNVYYYVLRLITENPAYEDGEEWSNGYVFRIPKSKINRPDAVKYME